jgi:hypothetical protein
MQLSSAETAGFTCSSSRYRSQAAIFRGSCATRPRICRRAAAAAGFGFEGDGADFTCPAPSERQHIDSHELGVADLLGRLFPQGFNRAAAFDHLAARRQYIGILGIHRRDGGGIALVEGFSPFVAQLLDHRPALRQRRLGE